MTFARHAIPIILMGCALGLAVGEIVAFIIAYATWRP
jgi:hypothetical protein